MSYRTVSWNTLSRSLHDSRPAIPAGLLTARVQIQGFARYWLGDALTDVESAVDREVVRRVPGNSSDRETRLSMRAVAIIDNGDPDQIQAFARELLDHVESERAGR